MRHTRSQSLHELSRAEIQALAKENGLKANLKTEELKRLLLEEKALPPRLASITETSSGRRASHDHERGGREHKKRVEEEEEVTDSNGHKEVPKELEELLFTLAEEQHVKVNEVIHRGVETVVYDGVMRVNRHMRKVAVVGKWGNTYNEITLFRKLGEHPHVVKCYASSKRRMSCGQASYALVLDFLEGKEPEELRMPCHQRALWKIREALEAIAFLHSKHVVHRDIKPEHIQFNPRTNKWVLCDLDCATSLEQRDRCFKPEIGTSGFIAPEVAHVNGEHGYDTKCDMWSFGQLIYTEFNPIKRSSNTANEDELRVWRTLVTLARKLSHRDAANRPTALEAIAFLEQAFSQHTSADKENLENAAF